MSAFQRCMAGCAMRGNNERDHNFGSEGGAGRSMCLQNLYMFLVFQSQVLLIFLATACGHCSSNSSFGEILCLSEWFRGTWVQTVAIREDQQRATVHHGCFVLLLVPCTPYGHHTKRNIGWNLNVGRVKKHLSHLRSQQSKCCHDICATVIVVYHRAAIHDTSRLLYLRWR